MRVVSTNFAKTSFCKREYDVISWRQKRGILATMTTIHHCSTLEFGRGRAIKQSPRASPDLCTPCTGFRIAEWLCAWKSCECSKLSISRWWTYVGTVTIKNSAKADTDRKDVETSTSEKLGIVSFSKRIPKLFPKYNIQKMCRWCQIRFLVIIDTVEKGALTF